MLNMEFDQIVIIDTAAMEWQPSPSQGVWRKPLEREAKESGHTTSLVKYAADSCFPSHKHPLGEEILVLDGVFSDQTGDFGPGSYLRNPPGSEHSPLSRSGCTLFVKLNQFMVKDHEEVRIDTLNTDWHQGDNGFAAIPLHLCGHQHTALVSCPPDLTFPPHPAIGGEEILILSGALNDEHGHYPALSWLRLPHLSKRTFTASEGTVLLYKTGHLPISL